MPPKDAKKKGGAAPKREIDKALYIRKPVPIDNSSQSANVEEALLPATSSSSAVCNIESLFPEWSVLGEAWTEPLPEGASDGIKYPLHLVGHDSSRVVTYQSLKAFLGLDVDNTPVDPKAKKKEAPKKGSAPTDITEELAVDETGRPLPRVFIDEIDEANDDNSYLVDTFNVHSKTGLSRIWSAEQNDRRAYQTSLAAHITGLYESNSSRETPYTDEELASMKAQLQEQLDSALQQRDVEKEAPAGEQLDSVLCSVFNLVASYAKPIMKAKAAGTGAECGHTGMDYLWNAIYPKLPSGRPCYNPSGRYCVRLFLGGIWRKVTVSDDVPVDPTTGKPLIASSANPLELWPLILAKAIYTVYTAIGLDQSLPSLYDLEEQPASSSEDSTAAAPSALAYKPSAKKTAAFVGFATHLLTGWQPGGPWDINAVACSDVARANTMLQEMLYRGVLAVDAAMVPGKVPSCEILDLANRDSGGILKTKKQFRDEFRALAANRQVAVEALERRELMCNGISSYLDNTSFRESHSISFVDGSSTRSLPVLALSPPADGEELSEFERLSKTRVLVHWRVIQTAQQKKRLSKRPTINSELSPHLHGLDQPLPPATDVDYEWLSIGELMTLGAYVVSVDTMVALPKQQHLGWHWTGSTGDAAVADPKAAKGKKDAKAAAGEPAAADLKCRDPGDMPTCFVSVDTTTFFKEPADVAAEASTEEREAVAEQQRQLGGEEVKQTPIASHLTVSIFVHADVVRSSAPCAMPSDVVIVLQEIRSDAVDPLVMRLEMGRQASVPTGRATFHIPSNRVNRDGKPHVFWLRLFSSSSVFITVSCGTDISAGPAESVWKSSLPGRSALIRDGDSGSNLKAGIEQLLFRLPLQVQSESPIDTDTAYVFLHISERNVLPHVSLMVTSSIASAEGESADGAEFFCSPLPRLQGDDIAVFAPINKLKTLVGRLHSGRVSIPYPFKWRLIVLSSKALVEPVKPVVEAVPTQRFRGSYYPNNQLCVFRDVISFDKQSFPVALKIQLVDLPPPAIEAPAAAPAGAEEAPAAAEEAPAAAAEDSNSASGEAEGGEEEEVPQTDTPALTPPLHDNVVNRINFTVNLYRSQDRRLVASYFARDLVQLYSIRINDYLDEGEPEPVYVPAAADGKGKAAPPKKDDKKKGGAAGMAGDEGTKVIVEVLVDRLHMVVPEHYFSRYPFRFDEEIACGNDYNGISRSRLFDWTLDVLAGSAIESVCDTCGLERFAAVKNDWEEAQEGRYDRSIHAKSYNDEKKAVYLSAEGGGRTVVSDAILTYLSTAIEKDLSIVKQREETIVESPMYREYVDDSDSVLSKVLVGDDMREEARAARALIIEPQPTVSSLLSTAQSFNSRARDEVVARTVALMEVATAHVEELKAAWGPRELYRLEVEEKNRALAALLAKAAEAVQAVADAEDELANPGRAKGKPKGKK